MQEMYLRDKIAALDTVSYETVDSLIQEIEERNQSTREFSDLITYKMGAFHKSNYDIDSIEYMRQRFSISKKDKDATKAVFSRGRRAMFQRLEKEEEKRLDELCEEYCVTEKVEKSKRNPFNRLVKWYNKIEQKHPLMANMTVSILAYNLGDIITQLSTRGSYELRDAAVLVPMTILYGWELPKIFQVLEEKIPIYDFRIPVREWLNPKLLKRNIKKKKGDILRNLYFQAYGLAFWLPRHFAALEAKKPQSLEQTWENLKTGEFAEKSTALGVAQLPITLAINHVLLTKMDLQYRFLALGGVNIVWSAVASMISNMQ